MTAECARTLASQLRDKGDLEASRRLIYRSLAVFQVVFGEEHRLTLECSVALAKLFEASGDLDAAEGMLQRVRTALERGDGGNALLGVVLDNLGELSEQSRSVAEAEAYYRKALAVFERECGPSHRDTAVCLDKLADLLLGQSRLDEAERAATRALEIWRQIRGQDDLDASVSLSLLGRIATQRGDPARARCLKMYSCSESERLVRIIPTRKLPEEPSTDS